MIAASKGTNLDSLIQAHLTATRMEMLKDIGNEGMGRKIESVASITEKAVVQSQPFSYSEEDLIKALREELPAALKECAPDLLRELGFIKPEGKDGK